MDSPRRAPPEGERSVSSNTSLGVVVAATAGYGLAEAGACGVIIEATTAADALGEKERVVQHVSRRGGSSSVSGRVSGVFYFFFHLLLFPLVLFSPRGCPAPQIGGVSLP